MSYKKNDLVRIAGNSNGHEFRIGEIVRLRERDSDTLKVWIAEYLDGHDYWYVRESDMKPAKAEIMPQKIVITTDGKTTLARLFDGKAMVKRAETKCAPSDTFDFGVGAELAFKRLMATEPAKEDKPAESQPVKLYYVKNFDNRLGQKLSSGMTYTLDSDGFLSMDNGHSYYTYKSIDDLFESKPQLVTVLSPLVRRPAKVGEWVLPVNAHGHHIPKIDSRKPLLCIDENHCGLGHIATAGNNTLEHDEYLVLDGYHGEAE